MADAYTDPYNEPAQSTARRSESPAAGNGNGNGGGNDRDRSRMDVDRPLGGGGGGGEGGYRNGDRDDRGGRSEAHNPGSNLHVSGLSPKTDAKDLDDLFGKIGQVTKASIMYDPHTRDSRGFGFVMMATEQGAQDAIAQLDKKELMGKIITVAMARRARARTPTPGRYYGPPKTDGPGGYSGGGGGGGRRGGSDYGGERQYQPRSYDSRYASRDAPRYDDRGDRGYDRYDRGGGHDDRRGGDDYRRDDYRSSRPAPRDDYPRPAYDDRSGGGGAGGAGGGGSARGGSYSGREGGSRY